MELKEIFGRGQGYQVNIKQKDKDKLALEENKFSNLQFYNIIQDEYYKTEEDLLFLLKNTPIIPDFGNREGDVEKFKKYTQKNTTEKGIYLKRILYGLIAQK